MVLLDDGALIVTPPKTGSTWLQRAVEHHRIGRLLEDHAQHHPVWDLDPSVQPTKIIGLWRDEADWYASLYFHILDGGPAELQQRRLQHMSGRMHQPPTFRSWLYGVTHPQERYWPPEDGSNTARRAPGCIWPVHDLTARLAARETPLWLWTMLHILGTSTAVLEPSKPSWCVDFCVNTRDLRTWLSTWTGETIDLPPHHRQIDRSEQVRARGVIRQPFHDYSTLYDEEMRSWLHEADGTVAASLADLLTDDGDEGSPSS